MGARLLTFHPQETLKNKAEDFMYSTAVDRREAKQLEEKCAELERIVTSADVVEREQAVVTARVAALRVEDEKEEVAKAREMDALKRHLFNVRNDLENVFRTTLHDLNVAYQDQAFDDMVEEATTAREELPALRRDLSSRTKHANRVIAKQCGSAAGAVNAKAERDLTDEFVKLQARRGEKFRQSLRAQKVVLQNETKEMKHLGEDLERFQGEAVELRAAAAELRQLRVKSARAQEEYLHARAWAHTLAKKGPKALKSEMKRRRLAALTAATVGSFKAGRTEPDAAPADGADHDSEGAFGSQGDEAVESGSDADRTNGSRCKSHGEFLDREDGEGSEQGVDEPGSGSNSSRVDAFSPAERRDTLTLVSGMEVGGLGVDVDAAVATASERRSKMLLAKKREGAVDQQPSAARGRHGKAKRWPEDESERIWRASLNGEKRERIDESTTNNSGGMIPEVAAAHRSGGERLSPRDGETLLSAGLVNHVKISAPACEQRGRASTAQATAKPLSPAEAGNGTPAPASSPGKLPTEVLASMLLSEHEFVGGKISAADVLERARHWEQQHQHQRQQRQQQQQQQQQNRHHYQEQQQRQRKVTQTLPFPDLPYGFTDLGRRVNVEQPHRRGIELGPITDLTKTR
eukprot:g7428.t1